ncbi:MAG: redoxin domain-containing protein [Acidimicrobiia bacterium]
MGQLANQIRALGAEVAAIAVTATFSQMAFAKELGVDFPMLSDWSGAVSSNYGVQYDEWKGHRGVAKRSLFIVDPSKRIRYRWITDDALIEPDLAEAMAALEEIAGSSSVPPSGGTSERARGVLARYEAP